MADYTNDLLKDEWTFYEHIKSDKLNYDKCTKKLCTVDTIYDFWNVFNCMYNPVELFYRKETGKPYYVIDNGNREISSISMFKNNIEPKWEDPSNKSGGEFVIKKFASMDPLIHVDKLWNNLCVFAISRSEHICGVRVIDSSQQQTGKILYRVELWIDDVNIRSKIEHELLNCTIGNTKIIDKYDKLEFKEHSC